MKRFAFPLGLIAFALACTDATSPDRHSGLTLNDPTVSAVVGEKPPPPVDVAMVISIASPGTAVFTGVYFSHGMLSDEGLPTETFDGTAWLRLDNTQPTPNLGDASRNTRFKRQDDNKTGMGTLTFLEGGVYVSYTITVVEEFIPSPNSNCEFNFQTCVTIVFRAIDNTPAKAEHIGTLTAFNVEGCQFIPPVEGSGIGFFSCPEG